MPRPRRQLLATAEETTTPPDALKPTQSIARVLKNVGHGLYVCTLPQSCTIPDLPLKPERKDNEILAEPREVLVELETKFRNAIWLIRGVHVLVDLVPAAERKPNSKVDGDIINIVREDKEWRKMAYWPAEFAKRKDPSDDEESTVGKMPPSYSDEEEEEEED